MRRYFRSRSLSVLISIPSATLVVQAGSSFGVPATSTRQSRQAPTSYTPSRWHNVGIFTFLVRRSLGAGGEVRSDTRDDSCRPPPGRHPLYKTDDGQDDPGGIRRDGKRHRERVCREIIRGFPDGPRCRPRPVHLGCDA